MGDGPMKVEWGVSGSIGIRGDVEYGGLKLEPEYKYFGKGSCDFFIGCPQLFLPCPKYITLFPPLFYNEPLWKIQLGLKTEKERTNEKIAGFINDRAGKEIIPTFSFSNDIHIEVSRGKANDGEMKIRVVTGSVRLFIVKADGTIYEETLEEERVKLGVMSREDASALIASLYGKKELGRNPVPSDKHIESVTKAVNDEDEFNVDWLKNMPNYPWHKNESFSDFYLPGIRMYFNLE